MAVYKQYCEDTLCSLCNDTVFVICENSDFHDHSALWWVNLFHPYLNRLDWVNSIYFILVASRNQLGIKIHSTKFTIISVVMTAVLVSLNLYFPKTQRSLRMFKRSHWGSAEHRCGTTVLTIILEYLLSFFSWTKQNIWTNLLFKVAVWTMFSLFVFVTFKSSIGVNAR